MRLRLTAMLAAIGAITGFLISLAGPQRYIGSTTLQFIRGGVSQSIYEAHAKRVADSVTVRVVTDEALGAMIQRDTTLTEMASLYAGGEFKDMLRSSVAIKQITLPHGALGLNISYQDEDPERALNVDSLFSRMIARLAASENPAGGNVEMTEIVEPPNTRLSTTTAALDSGIGLAAGTVAGLLLSLLKPRTESCPQANSKGFRQPN